MAHLLIADDMDDVRAAVAMLLQREGHSYVEARHPREVEKLVGEQVRAGQPFDALIIDLTFDGAAFDGIELIDIIFDKYGKHPAIMLTGDTDSAVREEALAAGFDAFVHKPVKSEEFTAALRSVLAIAPPQD